MKPESRATERVQRSKGPCHRFPAPDHAQCWAGLSVPVPEQKLGGSSAKVEEWKSRRAEEHQEWHDDMFLHGCKPPTCDRLPDLSSAQKSKGKGKNCARLLSKFLVQLHKTID
jgi:hypothetical protein